MLTEWYREDGELCAVYAMIPLVTMGGGNLALDKRWTKDFVRADLLNFEHWGSGFWLPNYHPIV